MGKSKTGNSFKIRSKIRRIVIAGDMEEFASLVGPLSVLGLPFSHVAGVPERVESGELLVEVIGMGDKRFFGELYPGKFYLVGELGRHALVVVHEAYDTQLEDFASKLRECFFGSSTISSRRATFERMLDIVFPDGELMERLAKYIHVERVD